MAAEQAQPIPQVAATSQAALLLLADGRLPSGGYAHSAGLEQAVAQGWVRDAADLLDFLRGRAHTAGLVAATFAAAARHRADDPDALTELDAELRARTPSPALRDLGVVLGRMLARAMSAIHPHPLLLVLPPGLQQPLVYGVVGAALGITPEQVAAASLHESVTGPATAAVKLMSLDPFTAHAAVATLAPELDSLTVRAVQAARGSLRDLPATAGPLADLAAELHARTDVRLFAS